MWPLLKVIIISETIGLMIVKFWLYLKPVSVHSFLYIIQGKLKKSTQNPKLLGVDKLKNYLTDYFEILWVFYL